MLHEYHTSQHLTCQTSLFTIHIQYNRISRTCQHTIMDLPTAVMKRTNLKEPNPTEDDIERCLMHNKNLDTEIGMVLSDYNRAVAARMDTFIAPLLIKLDALRISKYANLQYLDSIVDKEMQSTLLGLEAHLRRLGSP